MGRCLCRSARHGGPGLQREPAPKPPQQKSSRDQERPCLDLYRVEKTSDINEDKAVPLEFCDGRGPYSYNIVASRCKKPFEQVHTEFVDSPEDKAEWFRATAALGLVSAGPPSRRGRTVLDSGGRVVDWFGGLGT